jgi:F-type H+-transporting ATPase subunit alpha
VGDFEAALHSYMEAEQKDLLDKVNASGDWNDEIEQAFAKALDDFKQNNAY